MTVSTSTNATASAAANPLARKSWVTPVLVRMSSADAESGPNPAVVDGVFTSS